MHSSPAMVEVGHGLLHAHMALSLAVLELESREEVQDGPAPRAVLRSEEIEAHHDLCKDMCHVQSLRHRHVQLGAQELLHLVLHPSVVWETPFVGRDREEETGECQLPHTMSMSAACRVCQNSGEKLWLPMAGRNGVCTKFFLAPSADHNQRSQTN